MTGIWLSKKFSADLQRRQLNLTLNITEISSVSQSRFNYLLNFKMIAGRNAQQVFIEMEWE